MISHEDAERRITTWLGATPESDAADVLADTFNVTRRTSQVSALRARLQPVRFAWIGAAATVAVAVIAGLVTVTLPRGESHPTGFSKTVAGQWAADASVAATVQHEAGDDASYYWRTAAYDRITEYGYETSNARQSVRPPQTAILQGTADDIDPEGLHEVTLTVQPASFTNPLVLSPAWPFHVDQGTRLTTVGKSGYFAYLERDGSGPYTVTALVAAAPAGDSGGGAILGGGVPILQSADPGYPPELLSTYTQLPPQTLGPNLSALRDEVVQSAASAGPYDIANRIVAILQSSRFTYDTDVRDVNCGVMSVAECFATSNRGYCVHFALTMVVLLRDLGIPARMVEGFLPGTLDERTGIETIRNNDAHAWVEVYFTGAGWVAFDPTPLAGATRQPVSP